MIRKQGQYYWIEISYVTEANVYFAIKERKSRLWSEVHVCPKYILSLHVHNVGLPLQMNFNSQQPWTSPAILRNYLKTRRKLYLNPIPLIFYSIWQRLNNSNSEKYNEVCEVSFSQRWFMKINAFWDEVPPTRFSNYASANIPVKASQPIQVQQLVGLTQRQIMQNPALY